MQPMDHEFNKNLSKCTSFYFRIKEGFTLLSGDNHLVISTSQDQKDIQRNDKCVGKGE